MTKSSNKDFNKLIKDAEAQGWAVDVTHGGHLKWTSPTGKIVFSAFSPSDHRSLKNTVSQLKVGGFIIIKQKRKKGH